MGKIIAVFNQKGGVGKTTTVLNLATALSFNGKKVLICDIDPQANATSGLGLNESQIQKSLYDILNQSVAVKEGILTTGYDNLHLIPSNTDLAGLEVEIVSNKDREKCLKYQLDAIKDLYDFIFVDCPPSLGLLTINALTAADSVMVPIQCEYYALEGVGKLLETVNLVKQSLNSNLFIEGVLLTMEDSRTNLSSQVAEEVRDYFKDKVYKTTIPRNVRLAEAPSFGKTIFDYAFRSKGSLAYQAFAKEFLERQ